MPSTFAAAWRLGIERIPVVRAVQMSRNTFRGTRYSWLAWAVLLCVCQLPLILNTVLAAVHSDLALPGLLPSAWLASLGLSQLVIHLAASGAWYFCLRQATDIDDLITNEDDRKHLSTWLFACYRRQYVIPWLAAASGCLFVWAERQNIDKVVLTGLCSYFAVASLSFVAGNALYWLWVIPNMTTKLRQYERLRVRWQDPASTPGIVLLAHGFGLSAVFLLGGTTAIAILSFWFPKAGNRPPFPELELGLFVMLAMMTARVASLPTLRLYEIIHREKRRTLDRLHNLMEGRHALLLPDGEQHQLLDPPLTDLDHLQAYRAVSDAPNLPFRNGMIVQYSAVLLGAIITFILAK